MFVEFSELHAGPISISPEEIIAVYPRKPRHLSDRPYNETTIVYSRGEVTVQGEYEQTIALINKITNGKLKGDAEI